jgi:hypothetical protein
MFNFRWSSIAAAAAFIISFTLGISIRGRMPIVLLRALGFGALFFILAALVWRIINRYIPELLQAPSPQDPSLMEGLDAGSRVDITVGDREDVIPQGAVIPPEEEADDSVGNISEMASGGYSRPARPPAVEPAAPVASEVQSAVSFEGSADSPGAGMDQSPQSGYTQGGSGVSPPPPGGASGLGDLSGGIESLPDLDAMAGTFLSSDAAGGEEPASSPISSSAPGRPPRTIKGKGKEVGEDFNPKELASAIQTILKRD